MRLALYRTILKLHPDVYYDDSLLDEMLELYHIDTLQDLQELDSDKDKCIVIADQFDHGLALAA
jgi:hypothetical protein